MKSYEGGDLKSDMESEEESPGSHPLSALDQWVVAAIYWNRKAKQSGQFGRNNGEFRGIVALGVGLQGAAGDHRWGDKAGGWLRDLEGLCFLCAPEGEQRGLGWAWQTLPIIYSTTFFLPC